MDPLDDAGRSLPGDISAAAMQPVIPDETVQPMPVQDLRHWQKTNCVWPAGGQAPLRRLCVFSATLALTAAAGYEMYHVLNVHHSMTTLQVALLIVFIGNFVWIALPFVSGLIGFLILCRGRTQQAFALPATAPPPELTTHTALLMPTYNEAPQRIMASIQAIYESLTALNIQSHFDFFILSDTTEPEVWLEEECAFCALRQRVAPQARLFYRHRPQNLRRKAGNIADFCQRWGAQYAHMVILDADSLMSGETLLQLAAAMEMNPDAGIIQTLPLVVNRNTLFARAQQFAARIYGPVIAAGLAYWHRGDSSYWGHNAIIRTQAFVDHAGLPDLPGQPPFGGLILSHDFVEAALIRRAGWKVHLIPEIVGSYEESPPSLLDFAERDRRWCQGNLQHARLVSSRGLYWMSRLHLVIGVMSYLASPIWLLFIALGLLLALQAHFIRPEYFPKQFSLFPTWPVFDPERAIGLFIGTMAVLLAPKVFGYILLCMDGELAQRCGGRLRAGISVLCETVVSALLAPVMMLLQSSVVYGILTGRAVGWSTQRRDDGSIPLRAIARRHLSHTLFGIALGLAAYVVSPPLLAWMSPVVAGLVLAIPISALTGRRELGRALRRLGLLVTPEETAPPEVLARANALTQALAATPAQETEAFERLAADPALRAVHTAMLPTTPEKRKKGDINVDLLVGMAKLDAAESLAEAVAWLSNREKTAVLSHRHGVERLGTLRATPPGA